MARLVAPLLERELKVNVNVENQTGGDGVTGHSKGATAKPDGYTLTLMTVEINMLHWRGLTRLNWQDFAPAVLLNRDAAAIFVRTDSPWKTLKELEEHVRNNSGKLRAAGTALGGIWHLAVGGWLSKVGLEPSAITWVSIPGAAPSLQELKGGGLEVVGCSLPEARTLLSTKDVRCLGVMAPDRHPAFPDVPTFKEQGVDWSMAAWRGIGLPRGTPKRVMETIVAALERVVRSEAFLTPMRTAGNGTACELPGEFEKTLRETDQVMGSFLRRPDFRKMTQGRVGPMVFPSILIAGIVLIGAGLVVAARRRPEEAAPAISRAAWMRVGEVVLWVALYMALAEPVGFVLTAAVLLFALLWRSGVRVPVAAGVAVLLSPAVYQLFAGQLRVPLPRGLLGW